MQTYLLTQLLQFNQHSGCCCCCFISFLEPDVSVPRKPSEKSSFKWAVACGIIVCVVITLTAGLCFQSHKKSPKHGACNCILTQTTKKEFCV